MNIDKIVQGINDKLAGELLTYDALKIHMDSTIDDINAVLSSSFPAFTEFSVYSHPSRYPNYNFFPDRFIRTVVITGAAFKFFITDEEGIVTAQQYDYDYRDGLFKMIRDYIDLVPEEFITDAVSGSIAFVTNGMTHYEQDW